jgi:hypothetical protein
MFIKVTDAVTGTAILNTAAVSSLPEAANPAQTPWHISPNHIAVCVAMTKTAIRAT